MASQEQQLEQMLSNRQQRGQLTGENEPKLLGTDFKSSKDDEKEPCIEEFIDQGDIGGMKVKGNPIPDQGPIVASSIGHLGPEDRVKLVEYARSHDSEQVKAALINLIAGKPISGEEVHGQRGKEREGGSSIPPPE
jgi:hypothetical protein